MTVTPADLSAALLDIVTSLVERRRAAGGELDDLTVTIDDVPIERPKNRDHGDWASNVAMRLAKRIGVNPRELAAEIAEGAATIDGEVHGSCWNGGAAVGGDGDGDGVVGADGRRCGCRGHGGGRADEGCRTGGPRSHEGAQI